MRRYWVSRVIRKIQVKTTMRYYLLTHECVYRQKGHLWLETLVRIWKSENSHTGSGYAKWWQKHEMVGMSNGVATFENNLRAPQ
jgi:hypothetical protein